MSLFANLRPLLSLRLGEIIVMSGFFTIGIFFAPINLRQHTSQLVWAFIGILAYILSVYTLNSYADYQADKINPRLAHLSRIKKKTYLALAITGVAAFAGIFGSLNLLLIPISLAAYLTWIFYYVLQYKGLPYIGTLIHFVAGILHFHFGFCSLLYPTLESLLSSVFFALVLSAGHVNHEILDYAADMQASVNTTAVRIGLQKANRNLLVLFLLGFVYGMFIFFFFYKAGSAFIVFPVASMISAGTGFLFFRKIPAAKFKLFYRSVFALAGLIFCLHRVLFPS